MKSEDHANQAATPECCSTHGLNSVTIVCAHSHMDAPAYCRRFKDFLVGKENNRGFTLLELLVVIVIIGLLSGLVVPRYFDTVGKSKAKIAHAQMAALEKALDQYRLDVGTYPTTEQGLNALTAQPNGVPKWQGPYLKKAVPLDPWDHPYTYRLASNQQDIEIISLGSDGQPGGSGEARDIASTDKD